MLDNLLPERRASRYTLLLFCVVVLIAVSGCASPNPGAGYRAFSVGLGSQTLTDGDKDEIDATTAFSARMTYQAADMDPDAADPLPEGLMSTVALHYTDGTDSFQGVEVAQERVALDLGLVHYWDLGRLRPYVGGGLTGEHAELRAVGEKEDDWSAGLYGTFGAAYFFTDRLYVDTGYRITEGTDFSFGDLDTDLDSGTAFLSFGVSF